MMDTEMVGITPLAQLPLSNNFMFAQVMRKPDICQLFLEELLGVSIARLEFIGKEQDLSDGDTYHGIRLDIYVNDAAQTRYNIEMQNTNQKDLERRIRYYQSGIDRNFLAKGADYSQLPDSYVIFVCDFDYYNRGRASYERVYKIKDLEDLTVSDGSHSIILNSRYTESNVSPAIQDFLDYIRTKDDHYPYASDLAKRAVAEVEQVRDNKNLEVAYMTWAMSMRDVRMEGREEGRMEGREEGRMEGREEGRTEGIQIGEERGEKKGALGTLVNLVVRHMLSYKDGLRESGLSEEEFQAKIAEVDPNFRR
jgi:predicted transposase/invertase (TIGR01784 family)